MDDDVRALRNALKESEQNVVFLEQICDGIVTAIAATQGSAQNLLSVSVRQVHVDRALQLLDKFSEYQLSKKIN